MPQKRNPDAAELVRGKSGRIIGSLISLITVMKGLPLAYSKDMQEDKEPIFDASESLGICIAAMTGMIKDIEFNIDRLREATEEGFTTATDLADWLVRVLGLPFRKAHHITGELVSLAEKSSRKLEQLSLEDMQGVEAKITDDVFSILGVVESVNSRTSYGGTATKNVLAQVKNARERFL